MSLLAGPPKTAISLPGLGPSEYLITTAEYNTKFAFPPQPS
jgi:hypothetical protein